MHRETDTVDQPRANRSPPGSRVVARRQTRRHPMKLWVGFTVEVELIDIHIGTHRLASWTGDIRLVAKLKPAVVVSRQPPLRFAGDHHQREDVGRFQVSQPLLDRRVDARPVGVRTSHDTYCINASVQGLLDGWRMVERIGVIARHCYGSYSRTAIARSTKTR